MLPTVSLPQAIGAYVVASVIIAVVGLSGAFDKLMSRLPKAIAAAMLAGILFRFGAELFTSIKLQPALVLSMIAAYLIFKRFFAALRDSVGADCRLRRRLVCVG